MTDSKIKQAKQDLYKIQKDKEITEKERCERLRSLAEKVNADVPAGYPGEHLRESVNKITRNIHTVLQTETMVNACKTAKWSCICAAVAAAVAVVSMLATLTVSMIKMIFLMLEF